MCNKTNSKNGKPKKFLRYKPKALDYFIKDIYLHIFILPKK